MTDNGDIRDDTLRLVLSADQEQWLAARLRQSRAFVAAMLAVLAVCLGGAALMFSGRELTDPVLRPLDGLVLIPIPVALLFLLRHLYLLRKYRGYLADHRSFLAKYNRL